MGREQHTVVVTGGVLQNQPVAKQKHNEDLAVFLLNREKKEFLQTVAVALIGDSVFSFQFKSTLGCFTPAPHPVKMKLISCFYSIQFIP